MGKPKAWPPQGVGKTTKTVPLASTAGDSPHFCLRHVDTSSKNEWAWKASDEHAAAILKFIRTMSKLTWGEIEGQKVGTQQGYLKKHHSQQIESIGSEAQKDLARTKLDQTFGDAIFRFRLSGEQRLWGFREGRVFHAVWWDPEHKVYETEPN